MKRLGRWLAVIVAVLAVLVITAIILVKVLVTPERIRATVLPLAEQPLHRQVTLGDIRVGLFSGVQLSQLAIAEPKGDETFVAADQVILRYRFWPLLLGRVMIDEVQLVAPRIRIVRQADGRFNFSDLLSGPAAAGTGQGGRQDPSPGARHRPEHRPCRHQRRGGRLSRLHHRRHLALPAEILRRRFEPERRLPG